MLELEIKIIKFLLFFVVYSENVIMKNLGIDKDILDKSFKILEENGYFESYENFIKREKLNEESDCCKIKKNKICLSCFLFFCSFCFFNLSCCDNNIFSDLIDFLKIKVIIMKVVDNFF